MIVLAIIGTLLAVFTTLFITGANAMSSANLPFQGGYLIAAAWAVCVTFWLAWWFS